MSKQIIEKSIKHSGRIHEYNIKQARVTFYHNRGIYDCVQCGIIINVFDRIVSKRKSSSLENQNNTELYCKSCAIKLNIIVE